MKQKIPVIILLSISLIFLTAITPSYLHNKSHELSNNQLVASHIYGLVAGNIERPIGITTGLASDEFLARALQQEDYMPEKAMEQMMSSFLSSVKNQFGYTAMFVISDSTKRLYTSDGIAKIVNPQQDPYDTWYQMFLDTNNDVELETNRNQLYDYQWNIFVIARIKNSEGKTVGVCGIGLFMEDWKKMLQPIEKQYNVKIDLIDTNGLVQVDTDFNNLKNAYISDALMDNASEREFTYKEKGRHGFRMTRYMPNLKWYIVVQGNNFIEAQFAATLLLVGIYTLLVLAIFLLIFLGRKNSHHDLVKSSQPEDELTGLPNRNYLKEAYGELGLFNTTRYKSLAVFDIDHFKVINEVRDGDKIILSIVDLAKEAIDERGIMIRWSGDEFVIFLEMASGEAEERFQKFCEKVENSLKCTVSVGLIDVDLSAKIKINYYRAVQACYAVKENGGNGVGRR